ncbi:MAG: hypothetical protein E7612_02930 [Ruminococcaceae bacterium]|nr:hypothetical protein [Oscillospiraceae bacterium]
MLDKKFVLPNGRGYVTYEDFGAVGDGKTDDFGAIYRTHEYANAHKLDVKGTPDKSYYIFDTTLGTDSVYSVKIKTSVDFRGAHFIIDDTNLTVMKTYPREREMAFKPIFEVVPDEEHKVFRIEDKVRLEKIAAQGLNQKTEKIDLGIDWDGPVMIVPYNSSHKVFRRRGTSGYAGSAMNELIVVDKDGIIDPETPIMFSYASLDYIDVYKLDPSTAITIENGVFTTLESRVNHYIPKEDGELEYIYHGYIDRGMTVTRSYTTVKNIEHKVTGGFSLLDRAERKLEGAMYSGFFKARSANCITFKDCIMPGRTSPGPGNGHSSYNFNAIMVNKIVLDGCVQPNFWLTVDPETFEIKNAAKYDENAIGHAVKAAENTCVSEGFADVNGVKVRLCWGIGGTNFCKNMEYLNSTLSRFDAHAGLYHGKIINCNVSGLELTGVGDFVLENSNWYQYAPTIPLLFLRSDYGFHWNGDTVIKNVNAYMMNREEIYIAHHNFSNWYYGYTCAFPNVIIDNLKYFDAKTDEQMKPGYKANLFRFRTQSARMHLDDAGVPSIFAVTDEDGDGYIDEPRFISDEDGTFYPACDLDGDGKIGNTSLSYDEYINAPVYLRGGVATRPCVHGATHPTCTANLNVTRPPKYIKVVNNTTDNGEFTANYVIKNTSGEGISDGGWYRSESEPDTMGGYFGGTKFIYGEGEGDYFIGTKESPTETFKFCEEYYE